MTEFKLSILTPEGQIFQGPVESVIAPGQEGWLGVLAQHAPMIVALKPGLLKIKSQSQEKMFTIQSGVLEVDSTHSAVVLVDQATPA